MSKVTQPGDVRAALAPASTPFLSPTLPDSHPLSGYTSELRSWAF